MTNSERFNFTQRANKENYIHLFLPQVLDLVSCVLSLSQEHPESYYRWSELACDTLLNLLNQRSVEIDSSEAISSLERLIDSVYRDVLLEQSRVELLLKILFKAPPEQVKCRSNMIIFIYKALQRYKENKTCSLVTRET